MCFVAGINEAVVSQEIFDKAQELRKNDGKTALSTLTFLYPAKTSWRNSSAPQSWRRNGS